MAIPLSLAGADITFLISHILGHKLFFTIKIFVRDFDKKCGKNINNDASDLGHCDGLVVLSVNCGARKSCSRRLFFQKK